MVTAGSKRERS